MKNLTFVANFIKNPQFFMKNRTKSQIRVVMLVPKLSRIKRLYSGYPQFKQPTSGGHKKL